MVSKEAKQAQKEKKKLEKLKAEIAARARLKRMELQREVAAQALKKGELDKSWRQMMLKINEPVFHQDIEVMWHVFERVYDKKDQLITYTMQLTDVADDQFQRTISSFCNTIDTTINKFLADLDAISEDNNKRTADLLKRGEDDAARIITEHNAAETHLQLLLYHAHTTSDTLAWTTRGENLVKADEEMSKYANDRENLRSFLENNYNAMWDSYKAVLKAYVVNTAENQKEVRKLRVKENLMADIIASQGKKIANSGGLLKRLRSELAAYESGTKQAVFRDRRNRHRDACYRLKKSLYGGVDTDVKRLATLVKSSDDTVEYLEAAYKKGEKILRMAALCRKFETQREKVLPYGSFIPQSPTQAKTSVRQQPDDSLVVNAISTTCGLTRLWQRISKAELTKRALSREKMLLEQENAALVRKIKMYGEKKVNPDTFKCICGSPDRKTTLTQPVAVEGVFEISKFKL
ncbi:Cuticular protein hypothetical 5 [Operophtera brumata]|uniref:Dynein regulatory complex subunit 2 n=1 Tax=Operophtera brumata TaxID=104452 RepID=A0A0L7LIE0_OPEBR|nr:Cuticular protein hypothetical 5 [Operophtera brumata]